jgi:hypothetical protein
MTSTQHDTDPGPVPMPERPGPAPRATVIATLHALGDWLVAHPEIPAPTQVTLKHTIGADDEADEATRAAAAISFAETHDVKPHEDDYHVWSMLAVADSRQGAPVHVLYFHEARLDSSSRRPRYVR